MVPTVERGFLLIVFCSIDITGLKPLILSTSGLSMLPKNCLAYAEKVSKYLRCPSAYIVSKAKDDFPLPLKPVITTSLFRGIFNEMFLGPIEQAKPWNTAGISGTYSFLKKFWNLFHSTGKFNVSDNDPSMESLKTLHKTIKKIDDHYYDYWMNGSLVHLGWGWGGGAGEKRHRNEENFNKYLQKIKKVFKKYNIPMDFEKWLN